MRVVNDWNRFSFFQHYGNIKHRLVVAVHTIKLKLLKNGVANLLMVGNRFYMVYL